MAIYTVLGVDPGLTGGLVTFDVEISTTGEMSTVDLFSTYRMPTLPSPRYKTKKNAKKIDVVELANYIEEQYPRVAFVELTHAMPAQGISSAFNFGYGSGMLEAVIELECIPIIYVTASAWKKKAGLIKTEKKEAVIKAGEKWGKDIFHKVSAHSGIADAAWIGWYGIHHKMEELKLTYGRN